MYMCLIITDADCSRVSIAITRVCVWFCPHDKTKTAENKIAKLGTGTVRHDIHHWILGQKVKGQGHRVKKVKKFKKSRRDCRAAPSRSAVTPLNETAPHGRTDVSAQPLVIITCIMIAIFLCRIYQCRERRRWILACVMSQLWSRQPRPELFHFQPGHSVI